MNKQLIELTKDVIRSIWGEYDKWYQAQGGEDNEYTRIMELFLVDYISSKVFADKLLKIAEGKNEKNGSRGNQR